MQKQELEHEIRALTRSGEDYLTGSILCTLLTIVIGIVIYTKDVNAMALVLVLVTLFTSGITAVLFWEGNNQWYKITFQRKAIERLELTETIKSQLREEVVTEIIKKRLCEEAASKEEQNIIKPENTS